MYIYIYIYIYIYTHSYTFISKCMPMPLSDYPIFGAETMYKFISTYIHIDYIF